MPVDGFSASEALRRGSRVVVAGVVVVVLILLSAAVLLFMNLPDANAFNAGVERLFIASDQLTGANEIRLLEILAQSGTSFAEVLVSYRAVIFVLLLFSVALLAVAVAALVSVVTLNRRLRELRQAGLQVASLVVSRPGRSVSINAMEFPLSGAALETLAVLAEARMDEEVLSGAQIEAMITGRPVADCEEAAGATRVKRLRDALGTQLVSELLIRTLPRQGYALTTDKSVIRME